MQGKSNPERFQLDFYSKIRIEIGGWGVSSNVLRKAFRRMAPTFGLAISTNTVNTALFPEMQIKGRKAWERYWELYAPKCSTH